MVLATGRWFGHVLNVIGDHAQARTVLEAGLGDAAAAKADDYAGRMRVELARSLLGTGDRDAALEHARAGTAACEAAGVPAPMLADMHALVQQLESARR